MRLQPIIDQIKHECPAFKLVGGAADFASAIEGLTVVPAAFVLPSADVAEANPFMDQLVQQTVSVDFVVMLCVRNLSDSEGLAATETLEPIREALRAALLNWSPGSEHDGIEYRSGALQAFDGGDLWWSEIFRTSHVIRSTP
jgi:hypothetical protein